MISWVMATVIVAGTGFFVASAWFGTLRHNGLMVAGDLSQIINTRLQVTGITVEANTPKAGDISLSGTVKELSDLNAITALVEERQKTYWPSKIHVNITTRSMYEAPLHGTPN